MFKRFLLLEWKSFFRSASLGKNLGLKIFLILLAFYFAGSFLLLGIGLYPLLREFYPGQDPMQLVNRFVLVWLFVELVFRFLLQSLPVLDIKPLLILPVVKRKMVNFVLNKSLYSFFNFLPLFVVLPFGFVVIYEGDYGFWSVAGWMLTLISMSLCVNFINFILKKRFTENLKVFVPAVFLIAVLALLDYFQIFQLRYWFGRALDEVLTFPLLVLVPISLVLIFYKWNQLNLEKNFYLDSGLKGRSKAADSSDFIWARKFGGIAPFLQQDLKLIWRNKRPKTTIYLSLIFLGYGLFFYFNEMYRDMPALYVFVGVFITGIFMINFGQFIPSWDASYYPMIMTQNIRLKQYLASKAGLISFSVVFLAILSTPYVYFGWKILMINMVSALYNLGVNVPVLLYAGSYNKKRIDLDKSPFMNYQGTGATQWLVSIPLIALPVLIFWLINSIAGFEAALGSLAALGILGLLLRNNLLNSITLLYQKRKYAMIEGFKQSGE